MAKIEITPEITRTEVVVEKEAEVLLTLSDVEAKLITALLGRNLGMGTAYKLYSMLHDAGVEDRAFDVQNTSGQRAEVLQVVLNGEIV